jgi:hypothetical protein
VKCSRFWISIITFNAHLMDTMLVKLYEIDRLKVRVGCLTME